MNNYRFDEHYVEALRYAMLRQETRSYVLPQIDKSLRRLGVKDECAADVISLLAKILSGAALYELVTQFQTKWRPHLDRVYLRDYELTRWEFIKQFVFPNIGNGNKLGRTLDVGCERGCVSASLVNQGMSASVVGIDASDFSSEWHEREASVLKAMRFESVRVSRIEDWLHSAGRFDTILLFYVLHHSEEFWSARTLQALQGSLSNNGQLIVVEDSLAFGGSPLEDPNDLTRIWRGWATKNELYCLTAAYDAQVILDFVAVQLLAGFWDVRMPCNYKRLLNGKEYFRRLVTKSCKPRISGFQ